MHQVCLRLNNRTLILHKKLFELNWLLIYKGFNQYIIFFVLNCFSEKCSGDVDRVVEISHNQFNLCDSYKTLKQFFHRKNSDLIFHLSSLKQRLTHLILVVSFYFLWIHQRSGWFLMFLGAKERNKWAEIDHKLIREPKAM